MVKVRIYTEISFKVDMDLEGVDTGTRDYDVQQHRAEVHDYLSRKLASAFGDAEDLRLHYFEFSIAPAGANDRGGGAA